MDAGPPPAASPWAIRPGTFSDLRHPVRPGRPWRSRARVSQAGTSPRPGSGAPSAEGPAVAGAPPYSVRVRQGGCPCPPNRPPSPPLPLPPCGTASGSSEPGGPSRPPPSWDARPSPPGSIRPPAWSPRPPTSPRAACPRCRRSSSAGTTPSTARCPNAPSTSPRAASSRTASRPPCTPNSSPPKGRSGPEAPPTVTPTRARPAPTTTGSTSSPPTCVTSPSGTSSPAPSW